MRPRRSDEEAGSLDSLLDTMTNVVGILVILLVFTQLSVSDAVKRMLRATESPLLDISQENLSEAEKELDELKETVEQARTKYESLADQRDTQLASVKDVRKLIDDLRAQLEAPPEQKETKQEMNQRLEKIKAQAEAKREELDKTQAELARLKAMLDETPQRGPLPAKTVTLPNPRPAPENAQPLHFICADGQIYPATLHDRLDTIAQSVIRLSNVKPDDRGLYDCDKIVGYLNQRTLGDRNFVLRGDVKSFRLYLEFHPRPNAGEAPEQLEARSSRFRQVVRAANVKRQYARFIVFPDSFEVYLAARRICDSHDMLAGWDLMWYNPPYRVRFPGNLECQGKPEPKPKPDKPKPSKPKPDRPEPPLGKPPPSDQID